jgi:hypothetical protein
VDEVVVKRISQQLQKKCDRNREQRTKYSEEPQKFMESEVELNNAIQVVFTTSYRYFDAIATVTFSGDACDRSESRPL